MTDAQRLAVVRGVHTAIYMVMAGSVLVVLYAGVVGVHGWWLSWALGLVAIEIAVFAGSGMKCPLTAVAERYGAAAGADTFLPERFTRYTLKIFGPLIGIGVILVTLRWLGSGM